MISWLACADLPPRPLLPPAAALPSSGARGAPGAPLRPDGPVIDGREPGLACVDVVPGLGPTAAREGSVVVLEYTTWALGPDPRERLLVDTSWDRPGPYRFQVGSGRMISGLDQGVRGLRAGAVRQLRLGSRFGFGDYGMPERVPPAADLVVDLEVLAVIDPPTAAATVAYTTVDGWTQADLEPGTGRPAAEGDWVSLDWIVWSQAGVVLDTSFGRADPYVVNVGSSRLGGALRGARAGGRRQLELAPGAPFDERGEAPALPADAPVVAQLVIHAVSSHDNAATPQ
ncbi:MAG: FKBP-type peptidyl-prolyl cis-trans isomerase [Myxococcota bacterium]